MKKVSIAIIAASALFSQSAVSANWHLFWNVMSNQSDYYFDYDTVEKSQEKVLIWTKKVRKKSADNDGAWATAEKWKVNCKKRTIQTLFASDYNKTNEFIKSYPNPNRETEAVPGSVAESAIKVICTRDFPKNKSGKEYTKAINNDVFEQTRILLELETSIADPAPK